MLRPARRHERIVTASKIVRMALTEAAPRANQSFAHRLPIYHWHASVNAQHFRRDRSGAVVACRAVGRMRACGVWLDAFKINSAMLAQAMPGTDPASAEPELSKKGLYIEWTALAHASCQTVSAGFQEAAPLPIAVKALVGQATACAEAPRACCRAQ